MVLPDKVPVYVTTPTAPKLIVLPVRLPLMCRLSGGDDSMIVPSSALAVCVHVSEKRAVERAGVLSRPRSAQVDGGRSLGSGWRRERERRWNRRRSYRRVDRGTLQDGDEDAHGCSDRD